MAGATEPIPPHEDMWASWTPAEFARRLGPVAMPWYVVGGWALDLWRGGVSRDHDDLEVAVRPEHAADMARALPDLTFFAAKEGDLVPVDWAAPVSGDVWQFWGADMAAGQWRVDMMLERGTARVWRYKRAPWLELPRAEAVRVDAGGLRYLAPSAVLLFEAKHRRAKDEADFAGAVGALDERDRADLRRWLEALHPNHGWLAALDG